MFDLIKRWLGSAPAASAPAGAAVEPAAIERCLRAYRSGVEQFQAGDLAHAEHHMSEALAHKHDLAEAHFYLGLIHRKRSEPDDAADCLLLAVAFKPDFPEAWLYLGAVAHERKQYDQAREYFEAALRWRSDYAEAYHGLGKVAEDCEKFDAAAAHYRKAIELNPGFALAYSNLAYVTLRGHLDDEVALTHAHKALELDPDLTDAHRTLAQILQFQGRCREAISACDAALSRGPDAANTRMIKAYAHLMLGEFEAGWRDHEARKQVYPLFKTRKLPYPEWDGSVLAGHRILVYHEQGLGDEIMFASCLPDVLAQGGHCIVECSAKLEPLFRRSFPAATIVVGDQTSPDMSYLQALPRCDWQVAAGSLPRYFRRHREDFPRAGGYLVAAAQRIEYWRARLQQAGARTNVGLSWRGGALHTNQSNRSIELQRLLPVMKTPGCEFVSLQYGDCRSEIDELYERHGIRAQHWPEAIENYDETAALVSALDLVITVDTSAAHLSGALGKPTWVLVPATAEWRYMAEGERMPWYPSVRLFRQLRGENWEHVINNVARELARAGDAGA